MHEGQPAPEEAEANASSVDVETLDSDHRAALELMEEICAATGQEVRPVVRSIQPPYLHIELVGDDVRATWGRMGHALDALQLLANMILARRIDTDVRLILDADGYRERRAEALRERAREIAKEVKLRNEEAELEPLPPHERRIIHTALADDPDIQTYSEGDEPGRRVVISPRR
ncbi:MAG TPA: R3H domain-containing nucleic acid-binding protein [Chthonomonadaceae bacterium]|nr:R3H domain-containing nucleic acid-binding protein [Chthonomonadaceae bacterium]